MSCLVEERRGNKPAQQNIWKRIITNYSRRSITVPSERLPALAGIVVKLEKYWSDKCVAGMWMNCFHELLFWRVAGVSQPRAIQHANATQFRDGGPRLWHLLGLGFHAKVQ
jgi:hypothetical protein